MECEELKDLTPEMMAVFKQLQTSILNDYGPKEADDEQIYRFLRARDFDIKRSEAMLRNHIEFWQAMQEKLKTYKMDKLQEKHLRIPIISFTKEGMPLAFVRLGNVDFKGLLKSVKQESITIGLASDVFEGERLLDEQSKKLNRRINRWSIILDLGNLQMSQVLFKPNIEILLKLLSLYEANFPERLGTAFIINASAVFTIGFNVAKTVLAEKTLSKIHIFGADGWEEEILKHVDKEELPIFLGGKKIGPDGDPFCGTVKEGEIIPKELYFRSPERRLRGKKDVKEHVLGRGETWDISLDVTEVRSEIVWKFETESGDISFGFFYSKNYMPNEAIVPLKRVDAHIELEEGSYLCEKRGKYILTFDNTHSWLKQKWLFCKVFIAAPNSEEIIATR